MTATKDKPALPPFEGRDVSRAAMKITGAGTGLSEGLSAQPIAYEVGDDEYFVVKVHVAGIHHDEDKNGLLVRVHKSKVDEMAPIDQATAQKALQTYAEETKRVKDEVDGQLRMDDEAAAVAAEKLDEDGTPNEIAEAAAKRAGRKSAD